VGPPPPTHLHKTRLQSARGAEESGVEELLIWQWHLFIYYFVTFREVGMLYSTRTRNRNPGAVS